MHRRFAARPVAGFDRRPGIRLFHLRSPCSADRPLRSPAAGGASTATASPSVYAAPNRTQSHTETGGGRRRASGARGTERPGTQPFTSLPSRWRPGGRGPREVRAMLDCEARPLEHPASIHLKLRDELLNAEISTRSPRQRPWCKAGDVSITVRGRVVGCCAPHRGPAVRSVVQMASGAAPLAGCCGASVRQ